jgi:hypothetical protein
VLVLGEELIPSTSLDKVLSVDHNGGLVEARPEGFPHQVGRGGVIVAFATVDLL